MPVTDGFSRGVNDLLPVVPSTIIGDLAAEVHNPDVVVPAKPVVVHDDDLHHQVSEVETRDEKLERLVENWDERVFLDLGFPLAQPLSLVDEVDLDVGICGRRKRRRRRRRRGEGERERGRDEEKRGRSYSHL